MGYRPYHILWTWFFDSHAGADSLFLDNSIVSPDKAAALCSLRTADTAPLRFLYVLLTHVQCRLT
jgi:hypothetical protein